MKSANKIIILLVAVAVVAAVLLHQTSRGKAEVKVTLETKFGAQFSAVLDGIELGERLPDTAELEVSVTGGDLFDEEGEIVPNSHTATLEMTNLKELGRLLAKSGNIEVLDLQSCPELTSLEGIEQIPSLKSLNIVDCPKFADAKGIGSLKSVESLVVVACKALSDVSELGGMTALNSMDLSGCEKLTALPDLSEISKLEYIYLSGCFDLESADFSGNTSLRQLLVDGCRSLKAVGGLQNLSQLTDLNVSSCHSLKSVDGLDALKSLIVLDARNIDAIKMEAVGKLQNLETLRLAGQMGVTDLTPFTGMKSLAEMHLEAMPDLESLAGMPTTISQFAGFPHCVKLKSLDGIEAAENLQSLSMAGCLGLRDISAVSACKIMVQIDLMGCRGVTDVSGLSELEDLSFILLGGSGVAEATVGDLQKALPEAAFDFTLGQ